MIYLKEKVDAGADLIVTQLFYDVDLFVEWVAQCRAIGIKVPIVPGIMPIHSYAGFRRMTQLCKTLVPQDIDREVELVKDDDERVKQYGVDLAVRMCNRLIANGIVGLHFYTLNLEKSVCGILEGLNLISRERSERPLPWQPNTSVRRSQESVRPIFWSNRPKSYIQRTVSWDEFPNGRWGFSQSPAYGDLEDFHLTSLYPMPHEDGIAVWGTPLTVDDVASVFVKYLHREISSIPWSRSAVSNETSPIFEKLADVNRRGCFTINSQPAVNGAKSSDAVHGWGPANGYVYQKAYIEFFISPERLQLLLQRLNACPDMVYQAINRKGHKYTNNTTGTMAVTWGVFWGREVVQPTVVDKASFEVWKDEAFAMWNQWAHLYEPSSPSRALISEIQNTWYLVNIVDNDYVGGDIWKVFEF
jgi:methylenetetrahydrofolate reductase (NADPH)